MQHEIKVITQKYLIDVNNYPVKTPSGFVLIDRGLERSSG